MARNKAQTLTETIPTTAQLTTNKLKIRLDDLKHIEPLTENQKKFFDAYDQGDYFIALHGVAGTGKAQPLYSKILTPDGWCLMGDIEHGDQVVTPNGNTATVIGVFPQGEKEIYELTMHDGSKTRACSEHLWEVWFTKPKRSGKAEKHIVTTAEIIDILKADRNVSIDTIIPKESDDIALPISPYLLGALIGDGGMTHHISFTSADEQIINRVKEELTEGYVLRERSTSYNYSIVRETVTSSKKSTHNNIYKHNLNLLGLYGKKSSAKFIPNIYKHASTAQKLELIRGLMDTDGTVTKSGSISYSTVSPTLALDMQEILWSIGATCTITQRQPHYVYKNEKKEGLPSYTLNIGYHAPKDLFYLNRKKDRCREVFGDGRVTLRRRIAYIEYVGVEEAQCIMLDSKEQLYITDDYIVTHNTFCALYKAIQEVLDRSNPFSKIIVVRSAVQSREIGHLPGGIDEKMDIYQQPYRQICEALFGKRDAWDRLEEQNHIEFISTSFIRGMSFDDSIIIVDEMQNCNFNELQTVITRAGHRSKIIFCGDYRQNDLIRNKNDVSGVKRFLDIASTMPCHTRIEFTADDIVRSSLVRDWILAEAAYSDREWDHNNK